MRYAFRSILLSAALVSGAMFIFIAGCSSTTATDNKTNGNGSATVVKGTASKGPIGGGTVNIIALNTDGSQGALLGTATTNPDGSYSLSIGSYIGSVLAVVTGGTYTDEATNTVVTNSATYRAAVADATGTVSASITPFTELAVQNAGTLTTVNITASNNQVSTMLGGVNILTTKPADVTGSLAGASQAEKDYGLMLAALSQMSKDGNKSIPNVVLDIKNDLSDGKLETTGAQITTSLATFITSSNNHSGMTAGDTHVGDSIATFIPPIQVSAAPAAPAQFVVTPGDGVVTLGWSTVPGATSYAFYLGTTPGVTKANGFGTTGLVTSPYTSKPGLVANGTTYYFVMTASNASGESVESYEVSATPTAAVAATAPSAPLGVTATPGDASVALSWNPVTGATSYNIYLGAFTGVNKVNGSKTISATNSRTISALENGFKYYFVVTAVNASGESIESSEVNATPAPPAVTPPGTLLGGAIQGTPLNLSTVVSTLVAAAGGRTDVMTTDGTNLYIGGSSAIGKVVISTGAVSLLAGGVAVGNLDGTGTAAKFSTPNGITTDGTFLYVADSGNHNIRKIVISTGVVSTLAGSGTAGAVNDTGTASSFNTPRGITTDGANLYVADANNHKIRKIVIADGAVTTLAGTGSIGAVDGAGSAATFYYPTGITTDGTNLYVTELNNKIRKIVISTGAVTTLTTASFNSAVSLTTDGTNLYVANTTDHNIKKVVIATGAVTTLAGTGISGNVNDTGTAASFALPRGIATDGVSLYVVDPQNNNIRKIQ